MFETLPSSSNYIEHSNILVRRHRRLQQQQQAKPENSNLPPNSVNKMGRSNTTLPITTNRLSTNVFVMFSVILLLFWIIPFDTNCLVLGHKANHDQVREFHETLTPEERMILLGHPYNVPQYEMLSPTEGITSALNQIHHHRVKRTKHRLKKRSLDPGSPAEAFLTHNPPTDKPSPSPLDPITVQFTALSQTFKLKLWPNHKLLSPSFQMINEISGQKWNSQKTKRKSSESDGDHVDKLRQQLEALEDCFFQGYSETHPDSSAAVSLCNGMQGVIETKSGVYLVTPLPGHTVERYLNQSSTISTQPSSSISSYHIVLRKNDDEFNDYQCPHRRVNPTTTSSTHAHQQPQKQSSRNRQFRPNKFDLVRITPVKNQTRSKRSIDVVASDLNFLDADSTNAPTNPTAPIQLDDINSNDVYEETEKTSPSEVSPPPATISTQVNSSVYSDNSVSSDVPFNITVETAVFVDESLYHLLSKTFPIDTEQQIVLYVLTIMNAVQLLFKQPSIGRSVEISVVLMDLLKQQPKNLHPSDNIDTYLTNFCVWQHKKRLRESGGPTPDWDHALLLSGINMYVVDSKGRRKRHVVGLAPVSGMCNSLNSCTISEGTSFQTVLVAGHEMGHSLGMEHDGPQDGNSCNKDDFVMSPTLGPGKTTWSECSRQYLDKFVLTPQATCILGRSSHVNIIQQFIPSHQLPGERFSVDDQCQFRFGPTARHFSGQAIKEICRVIKCHVKPNHRKHNSGGYYPNTGRSIYNPYPPKSTYNTHPALEGTECGLQMWCREGRCVSKMEHIPTTDSAGIEAAISGQANSNQQQSQPDTNGINDVDNFLISRTKYPSTTDVPTVVNSNSRNHPKSSTSTAPKLNKLKPKPNNSNNPYHYKYNPNGDKDSTTSNRGSFGSRTGNSGSTSSSSSSSASGGHNLSDTTGDYLSTNKYNPYNDVHQGHVTPKMNSGWKPSRHYGNSHRTSPRPQVNGNWSHWTTYGPCISECVTVSTSGPGVHSPVPIGIMTALRRCNNPVPVSGGADCTGSDTKVKLCNAYQVCSIESSISAASGPGATSSSRLKDQNALVRYRIRTVDEYIADTCSAASKINDKLETHGTQYPSYDSASHSCYVWCHKRGGGYMSQGWRLPDGTPCGRKMPDDISGSTGNTGNSTMLNTGYCYNGQCRPFNCLGEMYYRTAGSPGSGNVYSGIGHSNDTMEDMVDVDCSSGTGLAIPGFDLPVEKEEDEGDYDSSYRLVRIKPKAGKPTSPPTSAPVKLEVINHPVKPNRNPAPTYGLTRNLDSGVGLAQQNFFNRLNTNQGIPIPSISDYPVMHSSNWSDWTPVTECQYSTACITTGRGFRLVTRECKRQNTCVGRREALQVCEEINQSVHRDPTLYDLYEQYCPSLKRITADVYAGQICGKYRVKYPSLLSGNGRQLMGKNSGCIVACEDRVWKDIHYQMDAFEDGKFPFGTDCSEPVTPSGTGGGPGYCLNGKCIRFGSSGISFDSSESMLYRSEILQLFAPDSSVLPLIPPESHVLPVLQEQPPITGSTHPPAHGTTSSDNSLLYSTISNELYKRATSRTTTSGQIPSSTFGSFNSGSGGPQSSIISGRSTQPRGTYEPMDQHHFTSGNRNPKPELTYATPRRSSSSVRNSDLDSSGSRVQIRRIKRSALNFGTPMARHFRSMSNGRISEDPTPEILFRKASVQENLDPESDYVSWTLIRTHNRASHQKPIHKSTQGRSMPWSPVVPKKPLRPIKLSHFSLTRPKKPQRTQPQGDHFQTFTLVKHDKNRFFNNLRNWQPTMNHIALPLGNQTRFLDDDEDEEEERNQDSVESEPNSKESPTSKPKSKIRKDFGLGHESWPNDYADDESTGFQEVPTGSNKRSKERVELRVEPYVWSVILSECSRSCGQGIRTVRVVCTVGQKTVDDRFCDREVKPIHERIEPCKERDCVGRWRTEPWSKCSLKCNVSASRNAYQSRTIICVGPVMNQFSPANANKRKRNTEAVVESSTEDVTSDDMLSDEGETTTTEDPVTTNAPPSSTLLQTRVYSILSHEFCDQDEKPIQWRSCSSVTMANC